MPLNHATEYTPTHHIVRYGVIAAIFWTLIIAYSIFWGHQQQQQAVQLLGKMQSQAFFEKDVLYRRWASRHGGVYVPVSEATQPNPYLAHIPERDITTPGGKHLTLMNPAYMTRQVFEMAQEYTGTGRGHITSLKPIRPANAPDPWETKALQSFERGEIEVGSLETIDGKPYYRYMKRLVAEKPCLKCHAPQGYREGDVRGGLSVSVPLEPFYGMMNTTMQSVYLNHVLIWSLGLIVIGFGIHKLKRLTTTLYDKTTALELETEELQQAQESLQEQATLLEQEIAEHQQAEEQIRYLKNYLANIIDSMPSMLVGMDREQKVTQWNHEAEITTGIVARDAVGRSIDQLLPDFSPWIKVMRGEINQQRPATMEKLLLERKGKSSFYDLMLYPLIANGIEGAVLRIEDVTERTRIQELMIQTEKMMSVGGLAAGMAHEINNPLGVITQAAQNIERRVSPDLPANLKAAEEAGIPMSAVTGYLERRQIPEFVASIREATLRASRIITNILRFSRRPDSAMAPTELSGIVEQAIELAANDYDLKKKFDFRSIEIVREFTPGLPDVPVVATEIEQVLLNLLKNAAQAMIANPDERKPCIMLRIRQEESYAVVEVEDNGPGMTEDIRRRVFEPFFTTKEPGIGTGLGLSVSYMIITQNHKGLLEVTAKPGTGARFTVRLPLNQEVSNG